MTKKEFFQDFILGGVEPMKGPGERHRLLAEKILQISLLSHRDKGKRILAWAQDSLDNLGQYDWESRGNESMGRDLLSYDMKQLQHRGSLETEVMLLGTLLSW